MRARRAELFGTVLSLALLVSPAWGDREEKETTLEAPARPADMPLAPLPEPPSLKLPPPRPLAIEAIDRLLGEVVSPDPVLRERARRQLLEAKPDWVSGLATRIDKLAERGGRKEMGELVQRVRRTKGIEDEDFLLRAQETLDLKSPHAERLLQILAINRMLGAIGSVEAVRELIRVYARFGDFIRIDVQNQLDRLGDKALAGLVEAEQHPAEMIRKWAKRQLDLRGKAIAHALVRTDDPDALADILVALGRTRNPDASSILIGYAAIERLKLQLAARQGIALLGESAAWALRDAYLSTTGKRPPREWTWKRLARELFTEYDRLRLERLYSLYDSAKKAETRGDLVAMKRDLDDILLDNPLFEEREKMAPLYLRFAREYLEKDPEAAKNAARRAARIGQDQDRNAAESLLRALEARELAAEGIYDRGLIDLALALDPKNPLVKDLESTTTSPVGLSPWTRYGLAGGVALVALLGLATSLGVTWRRKRAAERAAEEGLEDDESSDEDERSDDGEDKALDDDLDDAPSGELPENKELTAHSDDDAPPPERDENETPEAAEGSRGADNTELGDPTSPPNEDGELVLTLKDPSKDD
jgi:hypothetical protein